MKKLYGTIETQIVEGLSISTINARGQDITTYQQGIPQIQTVIQDGVLPLASVINAPFVQVTSVNGMTGDVITEPILKEFEPNRFYKVGTIIIHDATLYFALQDVESETFNDNEWQKVVGSSNGDMLKSIYDTNNDGVVDKAEYSKTADEAEHSKTSDNSEKAKDSDTVSGHNVAKDVPENAVFTDTQTQSDWASEDVNSYAYIQNKPVLGKVATSNEYMDLNNLPILSDVAKSGEYSDLKNYPKELSEFNNDENFVSSPVEVNKTDWKSFLDRIYPIGSIFITMNHSTALAVQTALGGGTWESFGAGRVLVGVNIDDTDFNTVNKTGGEKTHKLTVEEMPSHTHAQYVSALTGGPAIREDYNADRNGNPFPQGLNTGSAGGDVAHNNLQPFITVYMWRRIA